MSSVCHDYVLEQLGHRFVIGNTATRRDRLVDSATVYLPSSYDRHDKPRQVSQYRPKSTQQLPVGLLRHPKHREYHSKPTVTHKCIIQLQCKNK